MVDVPSLMITHLLTVQVMHSNQSCAILIPNHSVSRSSSICTCFSCFLNLSPENVVTIKVENKDEVTHV